MEIEIRTEEKNMFFSLCQPVNQTWQHQNSWRLLISGTNLQKKSLQFMSLFHEID